MKTILATLMVLVTMMFLTGCTTTHLSEGNSNTSISGDIPKVGRNVCIIHSIGYETLGPYATTVLWFYVDTDETFEDEIKMFTTKGFCFSGLDKADLKGDYIVGKDAKTILRFYPTK